MDGFKTPNITFKTRVKDEEGNFDWKDVTTDDYFKGKKVILFSLPGAFTPTCSTYQLPNFEKMYDDFKELGIDAMCQAQVHDQLIINVREDQAEEFAPVVQHLMEVTTKLPGVTLKAPPEIAENWKEGH